MLDIDKCKIIKQGILLYDNVHEYKVIITESDILYGTGDFEDAPEIAEDRECICYYAWCDSPSNRSHFCTGLLTAFMSIDEAMKEIEKLPYFSHWIDK